MLQTGRQDIMTGKIGNSDSEEDKTSPTHYRLVVRMPDGTYRVYRGIVGSGEEPLLDEEASRNPSEEDMACAYDYRPKDPDPCEVDWDSNYCERSDFTVVGW